MLSEKIKTLRTSHGINQIELAKNIGVTKQCVSNWENDNIQPSIDMLVKLALFLTFQPTICWGLKPNVN